MTSTRPMPPSATAAAASSCSPWRITSRSCSRCISQQPLKRQIPPPLPGRAEGLGLVAGPAGGDEVGRRGRAASGTGRDVVDLGRLPAAVPADPAIAVQHGTPQQRMNPPLRGIPRGRIPVQEWVGEIGTHSLICSPLPICAAHNRTPPFGKGFGPKGEPREELARAVRVLVPQTPLEVLGELGELGQRHIKRCGDPPGRAVGGVRVSMLQAGHLTRVDLHPLCKVPLAEICVSPDFPDSPGQPHLRIHPPRHPSSKFGGNPKFHRGGVHCRNRSADYEYEQPLSGLLMEAPRFELGSADAVRGCLQV